MIKVFYGEDRMKATSAIREFLGDDYEIIDATSLTEADLPSIFKGITLFSDDKRHILIRDIALNKEAYDKLPDYLDTPHDIALLDTKLDKRSATFKSLKDKIEIKEFPLAKNPNFNLVFDIYRTAKKNGEEAVRMLRKIEQDEDPIMFCGLLISQAIKDFAATQGQKEKRALKELSKTDLQMKSSTIDPWLLAESFLLRLSSLN